MTVLKLGDTLIPTDQVAAVDLSGAAEDYVVVSTKDGRHYAAYGFDAVEVVMSLKPSAYEGLRMAWGRWDWALHNMVAHPVMQILAWLGLGRLGVRLHDWSTPRPRRQREKTGGR